jgi:hypothetical protein
VAIDIITRHELGWGPTPAPHANTTTGMIAHYDSSKWLTDRRAALVRLGHDPHTACFEYWNRTRLFHINGRGWLDIGYAYFTCPDSQIFAGREYGHQQAAELPTPGKLPNGNIRYVAVTFGLGKGEMPTDGAIDAWHRLRSWLMDTKGVRKAVFGHRNFTSTDCPGDTIYRLVTSGVLSDSEHAPTPPTPPDLPEDETMYASYGSSVAGVTEVPPGEWTDIHFDTEFADPTGAHSGTGATILVGAPNVYALEFGATVDAGVIGDAFDVDASEYKYDGTVTPPVDRLVEEGKVTSQTLSEARTIHHAAVGNVQKGQKLRIRVRSHASVPVQISNARVSVAFWD